MEKVLSRLFDVQDSHTIDVAMAHGAYSSARKALQMQPAEITDEVKKSGLRGRGGAGFPTGLKWSFVPKDSPKPKYLVINGDESEPGTYKDRSILERDPHLMIEGIIIGSFALNVHSAYVYIRGEYVFPAKRVQQAIDEAYAKGFLGKNIFGSDYDLDITVHQGAGAYICGEETALLNSLEGGRGYPRLKPPFPATHGLFQCPTVVNNVETIATIPWILANGGEAYGKIGKFVVGEDGKVQVDSRGTRLMCISGHVNKTGVHEVPLGMPVMTYINEYGGGVRGGKKIKAVILGGSSVPIVTGEEAAQMELTYESAAKFGTMFGSGGLVVIDEDTCMVKALENLLHFYAHESCGQCTPCREGTDWLYKIVKRMEKGKATPEDLDTILDLADNMEGKTICPLAAAATMPTRSYIQKFKDEFVTHITQGCCPFDHAKAFAMA